MSLKFLNNDTSLVEWLETIEACHPADIELGLDRMRKVAERLPITLDQSFKIVVGGTNGKGTSVRLLESILLSAGYSVGSYTSPHFLHYNERIRLSGKMADDKTITSAFALIESQRQDVPLTYFEYGTLAALVIFAQQRPDILLLEVGLGGRLDSVNLVDADIALITTIALDHMDWLGPDRESIGFEKAGIFRPEQPAVCGDPDAPTSLIKHAQQLDTRLRCNGRDYHYSQQHNVSWSWRGKGLDGQNLHLDDLPLPHLPLQNAAAVLQVLQLMPVNLTRDQIHQGINNAMLTGRMQPAQYAGFPCILDVAHNPESATYMAQSLSADGKWKNHLVLGMLADKDMAQVCGVLMPVVDHWHLVSLDNPRGAKASELKAILDSLGVDSASMAEYTTVEQALLHLPQMMDSASRILIAGSFFTVTEALQLVEWKDGEQA